MIEKIIYLLKSIACAAILLNAGTAWAQIDGIQGDANSPNASKIRNVDVDLYRGNSSISIPIYEYNSRNIKLPISLSYNPQVVKSNTHPGWVGLGWNLNVGGVIRRNVRGLPDEAISDDKGCGNYSYQGIIKTNLFDIATDVMSGLYEVDADEFTYNFGGYSGKFLYTRESGWKTISDDNINVFGLEIADPLNSTENQYYRVDPAFKTIISFTLVAPDGFRYVFGGNQATEYSIPLKNQSARPVSTAWYLTQIISPENDVVDLNYQWGDPICSLKLSKITENTKYISYYGQNDLTTITPSNEDILKYGTSANGFLVLPVYLENISSSSSQVTIDFNKSISNELSYKSQDLAVFLDENLPYYHKTDLKWYKLDNIDIKDVDTGKSFRKMNFSYTEATTERLKLKSIQQEGIISQQGNNVSTLQPKYNFMSIRLDT